MLIDWRHPLFTEAQDVCKDKVERQSSYTTAWFAKHPQDTTSPAVICIINIYPAYNPDFAWTHRSIGLLNEFCSIFRECLMSLSTSMSPCCILTWLDRTIVTKDGTSNRMNFTHYLPSYLLTANSRLLIGSLNGHACHPLGEPSFSCQIGSVFQTVSVS